MLKIDMYNQFWIDYSFSCHTDFLATEFHILYKTCMSKMIDVFQMCLSWLKFFLFLSYSVVYICVYIFLNIDKTVKLLIMQNPVYEYFY